MGKYESRAFNTVEDQVVKSSKDALKLFYEFNHYCLLPQEIKGYFPNPISYTFDGSVARYSMDRIDSNNLGLLIATDQITDLQLSKALCEVFEFKRKCPIREETPLKVFDVSYKLVIEKTEARIAYNQQLLKILDKLKDAYFTYASSRKTWNLSVSHGDLCFSNILWDEKTETIKLVDPRGAATLEDLYLDEYYDLAKLSHSIFGNYEGILYGHPIKTKGIQDLFLSHLDTQNISLELLKVYEASLFLSMIPLHSENEERSMLFKNKAVDILKEIL